MQNTASPSMANIVRPLKVLVVDDNRDNAQILMMLLRLKSFEVESAFDGPAAISAFDTFMPDAILLDLGLPQMDGFTVCQTLRKRPNGDSVFVIAQSGWVQISDRLKASQVGCDFFMPKPIDSGTLLEVLASVADYSLTRQKCADPGETPV